MLETVRNLGFAEIIRAGRGTMMKWEDDLVWKPQETHRTLRREAFCVILG